MVLIIFYNKDVGLVSLNFGVCMYYLQFVDDDGNCYLDTTYYFDIRKDWGAREKC